MTDIPDNIANAMDLKNDNPPADLPPEGTPNPDPEIPFSMVPFNETLKGLRFEVAKGSDGWHWVLFAKNGRPLATNMEAIGRRNDIIRLISKIKDSILEANVSVRVNQ